MTELAGLEPLPVMGAEVRGMEVWLEPDLTWLRSKIDRAPLLASVELNPLAGGTSLPAKLLGPCLLAGSIAKTLPVPGSLL